MMDKFERKMTVGHMQSLALYRVAAKFVGVQSDSAECNLSGV